jgi:hypothetical protein
MQHFTLCALFLSALTFSARAQSYVETFTGGVNQGAWTLGNPADQIEMTGGNPGAFLRNNNLDTFAPQPHTGAGVSSPFTGDYRARGVNGAGIDLITFSTQFPFAREVSLMLGNDAGTPGDPSDDCYVYFISPGFVPQVGAGWASFDVVVPAQSTTLPAGWLTTGACVANPDQAWNNVITNVTEMRWFYGDPTNFFIFDIWQIGIDNPRVSTEVGTAACFGDGTATACPCGNTGGTGQGCANSTGAGAILSASGSTSVAADSLTFTASNLPNGTSALLFQGTGLLQGGAGFPFGDGLRCVGGSVVRLGIRPAPSGSVTYGPGLAAAGGWAAGQQRSFQVWYRNNVGPCGSGFNLSPARTITFTP